MGLTGAGYQKAINARRALRISDCPAAAAQDMRTLSEAGWDGNYVVPNQRVSRSLTGPMILLNNWFGWEELESLDRLSRTYAETLGYLPNIPTNRWLDRALQIVGLERSSIYITQACVFLPRQAMGAKIPPEAYSVSVERVLRLELGGRTPVALGRHAQKACATAGIDFVGATHPSYQGGEARAQEIAAAIRKVIRRAKA